MARRRGNKIIKIMTASQTAAQALGVWAVSIIERDGNILAAKSKPSFKQTFGVIKIAKI